ncbi:MAG: hypothetical protein QOG64_174, partial [Acidimicrobiaceae bacterium]|nr:hypothetical protein [Acidimicrobiaceae bacterium]
MTGEATPYPSGVTYAGALVDAVRVVGPQADRRAAETEALRRLPDDLVADLVRTGLLRAWVPATYGGGGAD